MFDLVFIVIVILCGVKINVCIFGVKDSVVFGNCMLQVGNEVDSILDWFYVDGRFIVIIIVQCYNFMYLVKKILWKGYILCSNKKQILNFFL